MVALLLLATAFAIGHHAFYQHLNGQPIQDISYLNTQTIALSHVSNQQINISIGTFFAFLVKALLGAAVSIAFDQLAWKSIKAKTTSIATIDNLFSILSNGFVALDLKLWRQYPISMLLACIIWLLPIASMISPATLNVRLATFSNSTSMQVPRIDFKSTNFAELASIDDMLPVVTYNNPTDVVKQVVSATAAQGKILPIEAPFVNSSWTLDFHGPALSCKEVDPSLEAAIRQEIGMPFVTLDNGILIQPIQYQAWTPSDNSINGSLPSSSNAKDSQTLGPTADDYSAMVDNQHDPFRCAVPVFLHIYNPRSN